MKTLPMKDDQNFAMERIELARLRTKLAFISGALGVSWLMVLVTGYQPSGFQAPFRLVVFALAMISTGTTLSTYFIELTKFPGRTTPKFTSSMEKR
jgi:uncharacterized membrane protein YidH (DUF202 family)